MSASTADRFTRVDASAGESRQSAVSWAAITAGAFANLSITLLLLSLVAGLRLTEVSPRPGAGAPATTFAITTGIGLIIVQWLAAAIGGFIAGRLRTKWVGLHSHEIFFRDTAHGFLSWALAGVISAVVVASSASSVLGTSVRAAATIGSGAAAGGAAQQGTSAATGQDLDDLFRATRLDAPSIAPDTYREAGRVLASGLTDRGIAPADKEYLAQIVAARTGGSVDDANHRIDDEVGREKAAAATAARVADAARKGAAAFAMISALAMLLSAFVASAAGAYGGGVRDESPPP